MVQYQVWEESDYMAAAEDDEAEVCMYACMYGSV